MDPLSYRGIGGAPAGYKPHQASDRSISSAGHSTDAGTGSSRGKHLKLASPKRFMSKLEMLKEEQPDEGPRGSSSTSRLVTVNVIKPQIIPNSHTARSLAKTSTSFTKNFLLGMDKMNPKHKIYLDGTQAEQTDETFDDFSSVEARQRAKLAAPMAPPPIE